MPARMRTFLVLTCLLAAAGAAPQLLSDEYLPPPEPSYGKSSSSCLPASNIYKTSYVTSSVIREVVSTSKVVVPEIKYVFLTKVVPSEVVRQVVSTKIVPYTEVQRVVKTEEKTSYKTEIRRGPDQVVQKTEVRVVPVEKTKYETNTEVASKTQNRVVTLTTTITQIVQQVRQVPQPITKTTIVRQQLPDKTLQKIAYVTKTIHVTKTLPALTITRNVIERKTKVVTKTQQLPAKTVTVDHTKVKTITKEVVSTKFVPRVIYKTQVNYVTLVETEVKQRQVHVTATKVQQRVVKKTQIVTEEKKRIVTSTDYKTVTVSRVQQLPGPTVTETNVQYVYETKTIPGAIRNEVKTQVRDRFVTKTTTVVRAQVTTVSSIKVVKATCGYDYKQPNNPLVF